MRLFSLSLKNVYVEWRRSLSVGAFTFFAGLFMVFFTCFIGSVKTNMETAMINALAGEVRILPAGMEEEDLFSMTGDWEETSHLHKDQVALAEQALEEKVDPVEVVKRVRHNVLFISDTGEEGGMVLGIEPQAVSYRESLTLIAGRYLENDYEVILTKSQAENLKVEVGEVIGVLARTKAGYTVDGALTVVGIGSVDLLKLFGYNVAYMDLRSAQELLGLAEDEATEMIVYTGRKERAAETKSQLQTYFSEEGFTEETMAVTTWEQTGGFIMGGIGFLSILFFNFTCVLLFIISALLINIISMAVLERRQEIGTLRAIGFSRYRITGLFMMEIFLLTVFFCLPGVAAGSALVLLLGRETLEIGPPLSYLTGRHFSLLFDPVRVLPVVGTISGVTLAVAFFPVYRGAKVRPADTLQEKN